MIDPADSRTLPLQKPTRVHFTTDARIYTLVLDQDLLGDWSLTQSWLSRNGKRGGKVKLVENFAQGMAMLEKIAKCRLPDAGVAPYQNGTARPHDTETRKSYSAPQGGR